ncbi:lysophospholipid acyltransferase family protein [Enterovirga rhinocerotis]|uniref:DUF374 domain-containing protein n=1 Tax=Enterovirga rhinocerotis TaxID=1339210 RepID=A0A4R7C5Q1_9HYPH|nr:lysophospholipid acyltransferase family protein [Enterovirga rhinocerotis]TDR93890.1 hypothetical protein EV668_1159 [Enterovirga rhinocerotis]
MGWLKEFGRRPGVQRTIGRALAGYLRLVHRTNRIVVEPADPYPPFDANWPVIVAMWHGQHFMLPYLRRPTDRIASLVSRSRDGEFNAIALEELGIHAIRGSGARGRDPRAKGGAAALRAMLKALSNDESIVLTADVPKIARRCGEGIVTLARLSGRPIVPVAVTASRRLSFDSWDKASIGLPFGRCAIVVGDFVSVDRDADAVALEAVRRTVESGLDDVHRRAFALVGRDDPGRGLAELSRSPAAGRAA